MKHWNRLLYIKSAVRHYFKLAEGQNIADFSFAELTGGREKPLTAKPGAGDYAGMYYVEISEIYANVLNSHLILKAENTAPHKTLQVQYDPYTYGYNTADKPAAQKLFLAMTDYCNAAHDLSPAE